MTYANVVSTLRSLGRKKDLAEMARVGMVTDGALGISIYDLRALAKTMKPDHALAARLWKSDIREARILSGMIDEKEKVTDAQLESMVVGFDSWEICDQTCDNLFSETRFAYRKALAWAKREETFVRRAGFTLMAIIGWYGKGCTDAQVLRFLPLIERYAVDGRNFVKKAVNWALRNIGKGRGMRFYSEAMRIAKRLSRSSNASARWVGKDALRELTVKHEKHMRSERVARSCGSDVVHLRQSRMKCAMPFADNVDRHRSLC